MSCAFKCKVRCADRPLESPRLTVVEVAEVPCVEEEVCPEELAKAALAGPEG